MSVRTISRWVVAVGERARPPERRTCIHPFRHYLEQRLRDGQQNNALAAARWGPAEPARERADIAIHGSANASRRITGAGPRVQ